MAPLWAVLLLLTLMPGLAFAEKDGHEGTDPRAVVQTFSDRLLETMRQARELGFQGREEKLLPAVAEAYDIGAMTRGAIGVSINKLSPDEVKQLIDAFTRYTVATYASQFDGYGGERFEVGQTRPSIEGVVLVPSRIVSPSGLATEIDYLLRQEAGGQWRIIDVLLDGTVSQVAVRRSEFVSIFRREGLTELIAKLDSKTTAMGTP